MDWVPQSQRRTDDAGRLILLVEDEEAVHKLIWQVLTNHGYLVISFSNAFEALKWVKNVEQRIPLVITDIRMPGMSGKDLADEVCRLKPDTKILFISASSPYALEDLNPCSNEDGKLLCKPFSPMELLDRVNQICGFGG